MRQNYKICLKSTDPEKGRVQAQNNVGAWVWPSVLPQCRAPKWNTPHPGNSVTLSHPKNPGKGKEPTQRAKVRAAISEVRCARHCSQVLNSAACIHNSNNPMRRLKLHNVTKPSLQPWKRNRVLCNPSPNSAVGKKVSLRGHDGILCSANWPQLCCLLHSALKTPICCGEGGGSKYKGEHLTILPTLHI